MQDYLGCWEGPCWVAADFYATFGVSRNHVNETRLRGPMDEGHAGPLVVSYVLGLAW